MKSQLEAKQKAEGREEKREEERREEKRKKRKYGFAFSETLISNGWKNN
jgi:hypothetical protein